MGDQPLYYRRALTYLHVPKTETKDDTWKPWSRDVSQIDTKERTNGKTANDTDRHLRRC